MYFPVGWPKHLNSNGTTKGAPVKVLRHRSKNYVIEVREKSVAFWHSRLAILVSSYVRSNECVEKHGVNLTAALKQDGSALLLGTSKGHLLFLRLSYESTTPNLSSRSYSTRNHGILFHHTTNLEVAGEGNELEVVDIRFYSETAVVGNIVSVLCVGAQLIISTDFGVLHRLSWDGRYDSSLLIHLQRVPFAHDLLPESRVQPLGEESQLYAKDLVYSPELRGFSLVLSDGRGAFITAKSARYEPQTLQGVWIKDLTQAVCSAINYRYKLLSFGKEDGSVDVYSVDDSTGVWTFSHSLKFTKQQFPEASLFLGPVKCLEWSYGDASVIAVSWETGGLSLWSVFGSLLLCSLGDQPGTPSPFNPHCTILESLCWSSDTYHLWMLPTTISNQRAAWGVFQRDTSSSERETDRQTAEGSSNEKKESDSCRGDGVLVMKFLKNSIVDNPIIDNHRHLFLQGSDRLYLNVSRRHWAAASRSTPPTSGSAGNVSSPQWKVVQLPLSYLVLNWPVKYAALDSTATNLAVAGKAGFALYSGTKRKWKLFGNEVQEQGLTCRGGLAWYKDIVVFPCRVQERDEEIRFYSLHTNLDNSQLLHQLKSTSPIIRLNVIEDLLVLASRDCHMTILSLKTTIVPNKGLVLDVEKLHEVSLSKSLPQPWPTSLISMVPSSIRTEPAPSSLPSPSSPSSPSPSTPIINSVVFNLSGKLLLVPREQSTTHLRRSPRIEENEQSWCFSQPVCLAGSVEAIWTPPTDHTHHSTTSSEQDSQHLLESLWLACGAAGIKVWLPLYPRDEGHPTFLSKRIMLTLPITVYPQTVLFSDAILYGLSHETIYSESSVSSHHSFPYATIERTTHVFLHHILRQLLRRNLGSHAFQIARTCSYLPYFSHVLELMLHEILEEEAPGSMPVPDALLPRIVDFIKQFPEFLETVGHCARKTEVALWQYLFAAVGNPKDLFELCISDGRLKTAATYLIIIQNLETASVSRQLATRLLDAALESNMWQLCKDIVRFLRAIGPGDLLESPHITMAMSPLKTPTPTSSVSIPSPLATVTNGLNTPDLDRSAVSIARDHLSSGSTSAIVSLSGDYKDASGKVIRRPQFVMDVDSKEEYFIELILSRHARKLLTARSLRDLGKFSAHLDFNLSIWLTRERLRAARLDEFVTVLQELHREFKWPYPPPTSGSTHQPHLPPNHSLQPHLHFRGQNAELFSPNSTLHDSFSPPKDTPTDHMTPRAATPVENTNADPDNDITGREKEGKSLADYYNDESNNSLKRANRPPDLDLSPGRSTTVPVELANQKLVGVAAVELLRRQSSQGEFEPGRSSTPTKHSGSISERVSLVYKKNASSQDLNAENSSLGEEEADWDTNSDVTIATDGRGGALIKRSLQTEKEIRYFADVVMEAQCLEWSVLLSILLMDASLLSKVVGGASGWGLDAMIIARTARCYEEVYDWAESECPGYLDFLGDVHGEIEALKSLPPALPVSSSPANSLTGSQLTPTPSVSGGEDKIDLGLMSNTNSTNQFDRSELSPGQSSSDENNSTCNIS